MESRWPSAASPWFSWAGVIPGISPIPDLPAAEPEQPGPPAVLGQQELRAVQAEPELRALREQPAAQERREQPAAREQQALLGPGAAGQERLNYYALTMISLMP